MCQQEVKADGQCIVRTYASFEVTIDGVITKVLGWL